MSLIDPTHLQRGLTLLALALPLAACAQQEGEAAPGEDAAAAGAPNVEVVANEAEQRVDVLVDGQLFTAYLFPSTIEKPVLYPIRSATGQTITRGFPLDPMPGERVDHPHHVGLWFNYGDVNGLDFWNNSDDIPAPGNPRDGERRRRGRARGDGGVGEQRGEGAAARGYPFRVHGG